MDDTSINMQKPLMDVYFLTDEQKKDIKVGHQIAQSFYNQQTSQSDNVNYFMGRNAKWVESMLWAKGSQPMKEFLDYMSVSDANKSYMNIDMTPQRIAAQFVNTVVEAMAKNKIYPCVKAVDDGSIAEKDQRKKDALYRMWDKDAIAKMQAAAGLPLEPVDAYVPPDELSAEMYFKLQDRLPKEIRFEEMLNYVLDCVKFDRVLNRKGLYDMTVVNMEAVKIEKIGEGQYRPRKSTPTAMIYNFFKNDTGEQEISIIGEFVWVKAKDFRQKYGKSDSNPNGLTEKEIYELTKMSTIKNNGVFNITWDNQWNFNGYYNNMPYDDYSIYVLEFEKDCGEDIYFVEKTDSYGKVNVEQKKGVPYAQRDKNGNIVLQPKPDNVNIIKRKKNLWMCGSYAPYGDKMLYWGEPDIIVSNYNPFAKSMSSWSINIPNNDGQYVPSLFERIIEPLREYTITKLKRKQLISQIKPSGIRIDIESARNIDLGGGNTLDWEEVLRIYNQTGTELYSSAGVDPLQKEPPALSNTVVDTSIQKIIGLTEIMNGIVAEIRMLIGSSVYMEGGDLGDRTAATLAENQTENASNVFGYVYNAHVELWEEVCYKLTCLHWNDIVKKEPESQSDLLNTRFDCSITIKNVEYERQLLEQNITTWSQIIDGDGNPLITPKDALSIREIYNTGSFKMAELYAANMIEERKRRAEAEKQQRAAETFKAQQESAMQAKQMEQQIQQDKLTMEAAFNDNQAKNKKEEILLTGILEYFNTIAKTPGATPSPEIQQMAQLAFQNIAMPLLAENNQMKNEMMQGAMQSQQTIQPQVDNGATVSQQSPPQQEQQAA